MLAPNYSSKASVPAMPKDGLFMAGIARATQDELDDRINAMFAATLVPSIPTTTVPNMFKQTNEVTNIDRLVRSFPPILVGLMRNQMHHLNMVTFPTVITHDHTFTSHLVEYARTLPGPVPSMGVSKMISFNETSRQSKSTKFDLSFMIDGEFARQPEGMRQIASHLAHIAGGFCNLLAFMAVSACLQNNAERAWHNVRLASTVSEFQNAILANRDSFGIVHKSETGLNSLLYKIKSKMQAQTGRDPTLLVIPREKRVLFKRNLRMITFNQTGQLGADYFWGNGPNSDVERIHGMPLMDTPTLPDATNFSYGQLYRTVTLGSYHWFKKEATQSTKGEASVRVYSAYSNKKQEIKASMMIKGSVFNEQVTLDSATQQVTLKFWIMKKALAAARALQPGAFALPLAAAFDPLAGARGIAHVERNVLPEGRSDASANAINTLWVPFVAAMHAFIAQADARARDYPASFGPIAAAIVKDPDGTDAIYASLAGEFRQGGKTVFQLVKQFALERVAAGAVMTAEDARRALAYYHLVDAMAWMFEGKLLHVLANDQATYGKFEAMFGAGNAYTPRQIRLLAQAKAAAMGTKPPTVVMLNVLDMYERFNGRVKGNTYKLNGFKGKGPTERKETFWTTAKEGLVKEQVAFMASDDIMENFTFLLVKCFMRVRTGSIIMVIEGSETGNTFMSPPMTASAQDAHTFINYVHSSHRCNVHVNQPNNIQVLRDVYFNGIIGGMNTSILNMVEYDALRKRQFELGGQDKPCCIVIPMENSSEFAPGPYVSLAGKTQVFPGSPLQDSFQHAESFVDLFGFDEAMAEYQDAGGMRGQIGKYLLPMSYEYDTDLGQIVKEYGATHFGKYGEEIGCRDVIMHGETMYPQLEQ